MAPQWKVRQRGLHVLDNRPTKLPAGDASPVQCGPPPEGGLEALLDGRQSQRPIHPDEMAMVMEALRAPEDSCEWVPLCKPTDGISIHRRAGESLNGAITVRIEAALTGVPVQDAALQCSCFPVRCVWDTQVIDFQTHDDWGGPAGSDCGLLYFTLHVPAITDRDFLTYFSLATAEDGSGYFTFIRDAEHPAYPEGFKGRIRADMNGCAMMIVRDEADSGSSRFVMMTKQDIKMPIIPFWLINYFFPAELRKWVQSFRSACTRELEQLRKGGLEAKATLPDLFPGMPPDLAPADPRACGAATEASPNGKPEGEDGERPDVRFKQDSEAATASAEATTAQVDGCSPQVTFTYEQLAPLTSSAGNGPVVEDPKAQGYLWLCGCDCKRAGDLNARS